MKKGFQNVLKVWWKRVCLLVYADWPKGSRVWEKALKKWKTKGNHHGIDPLYWVMIHLIDPVQVVLGSWYCFDPWYWKRGSWYWKRKTYIRRRNSLCKWWVSVEGVWAWMNTSLWNISEWKGLQLNDRSECMKHLWRKWWRRVSRSEIYLYLLDLFMECSDLRWGEHLSEVKG